MANHMLCMSFSDKSYSQLFPTLNRFLDYMLAITNKEKVRFCYIGTAHDDSFIIKLFFYSFLRVKFGDRINFTFLAFTENDLTKSQIKNKIAQQDILFFGPGNAEKMFHVWHKVGFTKILSELKASDNLPMLAGVSAGGMFPFFSSLTDSMQDKYQFLSGFNWLNSSFCPHADPDDAKKCRYKGKTYKNRLALYHAAIKLGDTPPGFAIPDDCMLHFHNFKLVNVISVVKGVQGMYVDDKKIKMIKSSYLTSRNVLQDAQFKLEKLGYHYIDYSKHKIKHKKSDPMPKNSWLRPLIYSPIILFLFHYIEHII